MDGRIQKLKVFLGGIEWQHFPRQACIVDLRIDAERHLARTLVKDLKKLLNADV